MCYWLTYVLCYFFYFFLLGLFFVPCFLKERPSENWLEQQKCKLLASAGSLLLLTLLFDLQQCVFVNFQASSHEQQEKSFFSFSELQSGLYYLPKIKFIFSITFGMVLIKIVQSSKKSSCLISLHFLKSKNINFIPLPSAWTIFFPGQKILFQA